MIFKYLLNKNSSIDKFLISSLTGVLINSYLFISYYIGYIFYHKTNIQVFIIILGICIYIIIYNFLFKILKKNLKNLEM